MTNINHNALSKFWFSIFAPSTGYSAKVQHFNILNLKTRNLFFFKNKPVMSIYTKNSLIGRRTYHQIRQIKKRHIKKNLVLKALQVKMYSNDNITNLQIFIHNPDAFYAIQYDYYSRVTRSRVTIMKKKHLTYIVKQLAAMNPQVPVTMTFDC